MTCGKCGTVLKSGMRYCPLCGVSADGTSRQDEEEKIIFHIKQLHEEKKYTEIAKLAVSGNVFAEYIYIQYAIRKAKTWTQDAEGIGDIKRAVEEKRAPAMAIWGITQYISYRPKGILEEIFEGPKYNDAAFEKGIALIQEAASLGDPAASSYMGAWCVAGTVSNIVKNERDAFKYTQSAANADYPTALYRLGTWYLNGSNGVRKNPDTGHEMIEKAAYYGEPSAVDFIKKISEKWFETDLRAAENQEQINQSIKFFSPINKLISNDIIYDKAIDLTYNGITFKSIKDLNEYKNLYIPESEYAYKILSGCSSLDDFLKAWDILKSATFSLYDGNAALSYICKLICKEVKISESSLDRLLNTSLECTYMQDSKIMFKCVPDYMLKFLLSDLKYSKSKYSVLHCNGTVIPESKKTTNMRRSLQIPADEPIYLICPSGFITLKYFSANSKGFAITASGIYYKDSVKNIGLISWADFRQSEIIGKEDTDAFFFIDDHGFYLSDSILSLVRFLKNLLFIVQLTHIPPTIPPFNTPSSQKMSSDQASAVQPERAEHAAKIEISLSETAHNETETSSEIREVQHRICPVCKKENRSLAKFCKFCGGSLEPECFCRQCGEKLIPGKKFCSGCGAKIEQGDDQNE